ncbi:MAG: MBL fold metallo-hydrolase [Acidobacteria bacterium]|nr:MBL fold metallo-hydrolase [Acidobacteriota bacterium]
MRLLILALIAAITPVWAAKNLEIYFVDVEGGQATVIVGPSGESMVVDTGWLGYGGRDADRIRAVAKAAKLKKIDYVLVTHYHLDHVGGAFALSERIPVGTFIDHGPNNETGKSAGEMSEVYAKASQNSQKRTVKPGDTIPMKGVDITIVQANGEHLAQALPGAGQPNPACAASEKKAVDPTENARSTGFVLKYGGFRFVDLGDLTWNKELDLACPANLLGKVDVYLTTHHGLDQSNAPAIVHALHPTVAIMNNGAKKGGSPSAWKVIRSSPGLEDIWQLHFAMAGGKETNAPDTFIANLDQQCEGKYIKLTVEPSGAYTVYNSRNKYQKTYHAGS